MGRTGLRTTSRHVTGGNERKQVDGNTAVLSHKEEGFIEFIGPRADSNCPSAARAIKFSPRDDKYHIARLLMLFQVNRILSKLIETNQNCPHVPCNGKFKRLLFSMLTRRELR